MALKKYGERIYSWSCRKRCKLSRLIAFTLHTFFLPFLHRSPLLSTSKKLLRNMYHSYGNTGCRVFKRGVQNLKDFYIRINILKGNYWILRIGLMGRCQKVSKFDFQSQFSVSKIIRIFLNFFFIEEYQFRSTFFVIDIFW